MYWCDLDVLRDLGFPKTSERIREELTKTRNSDNIVQWAWDNGFRVERYDQRWYITRTTSPYSDINVCWNGDVLKDVIHAATTELGLNYE